MQWSIKCGTGGMRNTINAEWSKRMEQVKIVERGNYYAEQLSSRNGHKIKREQRIWRKKRGKVKRRMGLQSFILELT